MEWLIAKAHEIALEKGWWDNNPGFAGLTANLHGEVSEAWEEYRKGNGLGEIYYSEGEKPEGIPVELADVIIRIFDFCGRYEIPLEKAMHEKMAYNQTRPYRHGGKIA